MEAGATRAHAITWGPKGRELRDAVSLEFQTISWKSVEQVSRLSLPPRLLLRHVDDEAIEVYEVKLFYHGGAGAGDVTESYETYCFVSWSPASAPRVLLCVLAPLAQVSLGPAGGAGYRTVRLRSGGSASYDLQRKRYLPSILE